MAQKLNIDIVARDRTKQALSGVQGALGKLRGAVFNLQNAFIGLGAGLVVRNLVSTGKELENLRVRLKFLLKDTNEGAKAFDNMVKFASRVPFSLEEIQAGSGILATVTDNANDLQKMLEITGNVAAVTGLDFRTASEQIQRSFSAGIGAADLFREKGVRNMLGFKAGATVSIEDTVQAFERVFGKGGRFGKATDELAETFEGTLSMIGDKIFSFKKTILEAGLFESLKKEFGALDKFLEENSKQIDSIAQDIGIALGFAVKKVADAVVVMKNNMNTFKNVVMILISVKVVTLFTNLAIAVTNVSKAMMSFGFATLFTKGGLLGIAKAIAKGGAIFVAFKGMEKLFDDMKKSFEDFSDGVKNSLPDARDLQKVMVQTKKDVVDIAETENAIAKAKEKELKLQMFLLKEQNKAKLKFHELEKEGIEKHSKLQNFLLEEANKKRLKFNELVTDGVKKFQEQNDAFKGFGEGLRSELDVTVFERFKQAGQTSIQSLKNTLTDFVMTGKLSFQTLKDAIIRSLVEALVGQAVTSALKKAKALFKMDSIKKGLMYTYEAGAKALASAPPPINFALAGMAIASGLKLVDKIKGFQKGGAVRKGQPVLVGEQGAEMFVPNSTGQITQSARGTDTNGTILNFNISATDVRGVKELLVDNRATIVNVINSALNEKGREALV